VGRFAGIDGDGWRSLFFGGGSAVSASGSGNANGVRTMVDGGRAPPRNIEAISLTALPELGGMTIVDVSTPCLTNR
jgi:hypothetical protein